MRHHARTSYDGDGVTLRIEKGFDSTTATPFWIKGQTE